MGQLLPSGNIRSTSALALGAAIAEFVDSGGRILLRDARLGNVCGVRATGCKAHCGKRDHA